MKLTPFMAYQKRGNRSWFATTWMVSKIQLPRKNWQAGQLISGATENFYR